MFGKCLKHEFRATKRQLLPLFIAMFAVSSLAGIFLGIGERLPYNEESLALTTINEILAVLFVIALFALVIAVSIVAFVMIIRRFYASFFTDEGYLTFTLPVTVNQHIMSKFVTAYVWEALSVVVSIVCVFVMGFFAVLIGGVNEDADVVVEEGFNTFSYIFDMLGVEAPSSFLPVAIVLSVVYTILSAAVSIFMVYLSISFACMLAKKHRVICGIVAYYIINMIFSTATSIVQSVIAFTMSDVFYSFIVLLALYNVLAVIQIIVCYIGTKWILSKKLNLD